MTLYRVVDLRSDPPVEHEISDAKSAEQAAQRAFGRTLVRSGARTDLVAKVYFKHTEQPLSMVRLYQTVADRSAGHAER